MRKLIQIHRLHLQLLLDFLLYTFFSDHTLDPCPMVLRQGSHLNHIYFPTLFPILFIFTLIVIPFAFNLQDLLTSRLSMKSCAGREGWRSQYNPFSYLSCSLLLQAGRSYDTYTATSRFDQFYHWYWDQHAKTILCLYTWLFSYPYSCCLEILS